VVQDKPKHPTGMPTKLKGMSTLDTMCYLTHLNMHMNAPSPTSSQSYRGSTSLCLHCCLACCLAWLWCVDMLARPPPGLSVLLSLMGGRQLEKALLHHVLGPGHQELEVGVCVWGGGLWGAH